MANWVRTTIKVEVGNDFAKSAFKELAKKIIEIEDSGLEWDRHEEAVVPVQFLFDDLKDKVIDRESSNEILGAQNCNLMAWDDGSEIILESAWEYPEYAVLRIAQVVMDADPNSIISAAFFEDGPAFIGYEVFTNGIRYDSDFLSSKELADDYKIDFDIDDEAEDDEDLDSDNYTRCLDSSKDLIDRFIKITIEEILNGPEDDE